MTTEEARQQAKKYFQEMEDYNLGRAKTLADYDNPLDAAKQRILDFVRSLTGSPGSGGSVSFVELERQLERVGLVKLNPNRLENGGQCYTQIDFPQSERYPCSNMVIWTTKNDLLAEAFISLSNEPIETRKLWVYPTEVLVYAADGGMLNLPVATKPKHYKTPHWLPVTMSCENYDSYRKYRRKGY